MSGRDRKNGRYFNVFFGHCEAGQETGFDVGEMAEVFSKGS